jgi:signal transduction histidine kinase/ActR/RegA family two-component response regulator
MDTAQTLQPVSLAPDPAPTARVVVLRMMLVALGWYAMARFGLNVRYPGSHVSLIWLPTGVAVAAIRRWGNAMMWPIFLVAVSTSMFQSGQLLWLAGGVALGGTVGPWVSASLLKRWSYDASMTQERDLPTCVAAIAVGMTITALNGATLFWAEGRLPGALWPEATLNWWVGDMIGALLSAVPLMALTPARLAETFGGRRGAITLGIEILVLVASLLAFSSWLSSDVAMVVPMLSVLFCLVALLAMRGGVLAASLAVLALSITAAAATALSVGIFSLRGENVALLALSTYVAAQLCTGLLIIAEHQRYRRSQRDRDHADFTSRAKTEFLSHMSHELRTPLNAVIGFSQLLLSNPANPPTAWQQEKLELVERAGWFLLKMVDELLDLSKIEAGELRVTQEPVDLQLQVDGALQLLAHTVADSQVLPSIRVDLAIEARHVLADATRLQQVLLNVIGNAIKYNKPNGSVMVRARRVSHSGDDVCCIEVEDSGVGMSQEQLSHLFEPFNRLGQERGKISGSGIGLNLTRRLVEAMGGAMTVRSVPDQGSTFSIELPFPANRRAADDSSFTAAATILQRSAHVLYIEDNEVNAMLMEAAIQARPRTTLRVAGSIAKAFEAATAQHPDLILLDMHLPDGDGLDALALLRAYKSTRSAPVIMVTADITADHMAETRAAGAFGYITKPFELVRLLAEIDRALDAAQAA